MSNKVKGIIFTVIAFAPLGISYPLAGSVMDKLPVFLFTEISLLISLIIGLPLARLREPDVKILKIGKKNWAKIIAQAAIGTVGYTVFNLFGLKYCDAVVASVIASMSPALTMITAFFVLHEKITLKKVIGILFAVLAVLIMTVDFSGVSDVKFTALGIIFMLCAIGCQALFFALAKQITYDLPPYNMTVGLMIPSVIMLAPFAIYDLTQFPITSISGNEWMVILFYGIFVGYLCYLYTYKAYVYVSASFFGSAAALTPICAALTAVIFFGRQLDLKDILGIIFIIIAILVQEMQFNKKSKTD